MTIPGYILSWLFALVSGPVQPTKNALPVVQDTIKVWQIHADKISIDPLGQYYSVVNGSLTKYDSSGDSVYSWSEPQSGRITSIDTGDPMRILVYQKDFNLLRFLNNRLAPISAAIRLDDLGVTAPLALAISRQGGFWVLDGSTLRIRYFDQQLTSIVESSPLNLPVSQATAEIRMVESGDRILLHIPGKEIQVFDLFANLIKKIPAQASSFSVSGNQILLVYPDRIVRWTNAVTAEEKLVNSSAKNIRDACLFQDKILIRTDDQVILLKR